MTNEDLIGQRFDRLTVVSSAGRKKGHYYFECECDCGAIITRRKDHLLKGRNQSCGCLKAKVLRATHTTHGQAHNRTPEYTAWAHMIRRCHTPTTAGYQWYGGRGISVCAAWRESFEQFLADVGPRPSDKHSIDRIDNDGHYEPGNVRWATASEQNNNKRDCHYITFRGRTQTRTQWRRELGFGRGVLAGRLKNGWSVEAALTTPVRN